jgi:RNA polymerase sigma-70 factor (ECF subfamily)
MEKTMKGISEREKEAWAIRAAKLGEPQGFQVLYELYRSYVYSVCLGMTREPALSEDLTHDIFLQLMRKITLFKGDSLFRTWLHRVAVNMVLLHFRRHKVTDVSLNDETLNSTEIEMAEKHPHSDVDTDIALRELVADLSPSNQEVLILHDVEGYRHQDISKLLGITSGASRSQLHKVRVKLRIALGVKPRKQRAKLKLVEVQANFRIRDF